MHLANRRNLYPKCQGGKGHVKSRHGPNFVGPQGTRVHTWLAHQLAPSSKFPRSPGPSVSIVPSSRVKTVWPLPPSVLLFVLYPSRGHKTNDGGPNYEASEGEGRTKDRIGRRWMDVGSEKYFSFPLACGDLRGLKSWEEKKRNIL